MGLTYTKTKFLLLCLCLSIGFRTFSEGTRQLMPTGADNGYVQIFDLNTLSRPFATFNAPEDYRLNIQVCNPGEKIYMGFKQTNDDVYFRLMDGSTNTAVPIPGLTPVPGTTNTYKLPSSGAGYIDSYDKAYNGPSQIVGAGGYNALEFTPPGPGNYYIEFNPKSPTTPTPEKRIFTYFDITVADPTINKIQTGRLWSKAWDFTTNADANRFVATMYIYAKDSIITSINFNGIQPFGFSISANSTGTTKTGDPEFDRQSKIGNYTYPEYKLFLTEPDTNCFPVGKFGSLTKDPRITGCDPDKRCIEIYTDKEGTVEILLEFNGQEGYQKNTSDLLINTPVKVGYNCIPWNTRDGLGNIVPENKTFNITVNYFNGLTHLPLYDVENHLNGYIVELYAPQKGGTAVPKLYWDDSRIIAGSNPDGTVNLTGCSGGCHQWRNRGFNECVPTCPESINTWWYANVIENKLEYTVQNVTVDAESRNAPGAPNDTTVCADITTFILSGKITGATGGTWSGGNGTFSDVNDLNAGYTPTEAEKAAGMVKLFLTSTPSADCPTVTDTMRIFFTPVPTVDAGPNSNICINTTTVQLNGVVTNASKVTWTGGQGNFIPDRNRVNPVYTPTRAELESGSIELTLTATGKGQCGPVDGKTKIIVVPESVADAGRDTTVCANNAVIHLKGSISGGTAGTWTGGTGTFLPDANTLDATYIPGKNELGAANIVLNLTPQHNPCGTVSDQMVIQLTRPPRVDAGPDKEICKNDVVQLNGYVEGASGILWSSEGTGTFKPSATSLNATYHPSSADTAKASIKLYLTSTGNGLCNPEVDSLTIKFRPAPKVHVNQNFIACANNPNVALSATVKGASGILWTSVNYGTFTPSASHLNVTYIPSAKDLADNLAIINVTTVGNDFNCSSTSERILILIDQAPIVNAGPDQTICANNPNITLKGSATAGTSVTWTGGNGIYYPNKDSLNVVYTPTPAEIASGKLKLTLTAQASSCLPVSDEIEITFTSGPVVEAGPAQSVCENNPAITLNGNVSLGAGIWTGGSGTFAPDNSSLVTTYNPSAEEIAAGYVKLYLTSSNNGNCNSETDSIEITIIKAPVVTTSDSISVCKNNPTVQLDGKVTAPAKGGVWSGGKGVFSPNANTIKAVYTPTAEEINSGNLKLTLTSTDNGLCNATFAYQDITFTPAPTVDAGPDQEVCSNTSGVQLSGSKTVAGGIMWSGGNGVFTPSPTAPNAVYAPSVAEILAGTVTLTIVTTENGKCNPVSDNVTIKLSPAPEVNAGPDQFVCGTESSIVFNHGTYKNATGIVWSTNGGGSFSPSSSLINATYSISASDKARGNVTFVLTTTGTGVCPPVSDDMVVTFTTVPVIDAGPDLFICTNDLPIRLNAIGSRSTWTGGSGTFSPDAKTLNATYTPSAAELSSGVVKLKITTDATGACPPVSDELTIRIPKGPEVDAGPDQVVCGNSPNVILNGKVVNATGAIWSTNGTGSFLPDRTSLTATYVPSSADTSAGSVILTLTSLGNDTCSLVSDQLTVTFKDAVVVDAGPEQTLCADVKGIPLHGIVLNASGGTWSGGSGTFSPNPTSLNATYTPSTAEINAKKIVLTLTSVSDGICPPISDNVTFTLQEIPEVEAGPDQTVCANTEFINLAGSFSKAGGVIWKSSGSGIFAPDASQKDGTYYISTQDTTVKKVTLTITTTGNGVCPPAEDNMLLTITPIPVVDAGPDQELCENVTSITLSGKVSVATGGTWTSTGSGAFSSNGLNAVYIPSASDVKNRILTFTLTSTGNGACAAGKDAMTVKFTPMPIVNPGSDFTICESTSSVTLNGIVEAASGGTWTTSGDGAFGNRNNLNTSYNLGGGDISQGSVVLTLTSVGNGSCPEVSASIKITVLPLPMVNAGPDQTVCSDVTEISLSGSIDNYSSAQWISQGTGIFLPNSSDLNAKYQPSPEDIAAKQIKLTLKGVGNAPCATLSDEMVVNFTPLVTADAGPDQSVCSDVTQVQLTGTVTTAAGQQWTTTGTGSFSPDATALNPVYIPSKEDKEAGRVTFKILSTGNGTCNAVSDYTNVFFTSAPTVNAGPDMDICEDAVSVSLNGTVTVATGGTWSTSGDGGFSPTAHQLSTSYLIGTTDKTPGSVIKLILTSTGNGLCQPVSDTLHLFVKPLSVVDAGEDQAVCEDIAGINLSGSVSNASGGYWKSSGAGTFAPNASSLNAIYIPSAAERAAGKVQLTLTSTGTGVCQAISDSLEVTFEKIPVVNAGPDISICADIDAIQLSATVLNATGVRWNTSGDGNFSPDNTTLNPMYLIGNNDSINRRVIFTATSTGNGSCEAVSDQLILNISPIPAVDAGPDIVACSDVTAVQLNGQVKVATGGYWTSTGTGTFSPNPDSPVVQYLPSDADKLTTTYLILTSAGNGSCNFYSDTLTLRFDPNPQVDAGPDRTVCSTDLPIQLFGSGNNATWSSPGGGVFLPNPTVANATYMPTAAEIAAKTVTLNISSPAFGMCPATSDQVTFTIIPGPVVNAGSLTSICNSMNSVTVSGNVMNGNVLWTSTGKGTFQNATAASTTYQIDPDDKIAGSVTLILSSDGNGICTPIGDTLELTFDPEVVADAGFNQALCSDAPAFQLSGTAKNYSSIQWSTTGSGTLNNASTLNPDYKPSAAERTNLTPVKVTMKVNGQGNCPPVTKDVTLSLLPAPTANPGLDTIVCSNSQAIPLKGSITVAGGAIWSTSGTGSFAPGAQNLNAAYIPSEADKLSGVVLTLTTIDNGSCGEVAKGKKIDFVKMPEADAGPDDTICVTATSGIALNGIITSESGSGVWSAMGTGTFSDPATTLVNTYIPSDEEKLIGSFILLLKTTGNTVCPEVTDYKSVKVQYLPEASAGLDQHVCEDIPGIQLNGSITGALSGEWNTNGDGTFLPNKYTLNASYVPGDNDRTQPGVRLTLTTKDNGHCAAHTDTLNIEFIPLPDGNAGNDTTVCEDAATVLLHGSVTSASGVIWTTDGSGKFSPSASSLFATYIPGPSDIKAGGVTLRLNINGIAQCGAVTQLKQITIHPKPTANAGPDLRICELTEEIKVTGTATNHTGIQWFSSGTGSFTNEALLSTIYKTDPSDFDAQAINLILEVQGKPGCKPVQDHLTVQFVPKPEVTAGPSQNFCFDVPEIQLTGKVVNANQTEWVSSGSGIFLPDRKHLNATYLPSLEDRIEGTVQLTIRNTDVPVCKADEDTLEITFIPVPVADPGPAIICDLFNGAKLNGQFQNAGGILWSTEGSGTFSPNPTDPGATYYPSLQDFQKGSILLKLTTTDNGICNEREATTTLVIEPRPIADAGKDLDVCISTSPTITANLTGDVSYEWYNLNGVLMGTGASILLPNLDRDTTLVLRVYDSRPCDQFDTVTVRVFTPPTIGMPNDTCFDQPLYVAAKLRNLPLVTGQYIWSQDGKLMPNQVLPILSVPRPGEYTVTYAFGNCSVSKKIRINPLPVLMGSDKIACENRSTVLSVSSTLPSSNYQWSGPGINTTTSSGILGIVVPVDTNFYKVSVTTNDGCVASHDLRVIGVPSPLFSIKDSAFCANETAMFVARPTNISNIDSLPVTYEWMKNGVSINYSNDSLLINSEGVYTVRVTIGECDTLLTTNIKLHEVPNPRLPKELDLCMENKEVLKLDAGPGLIYQWSGDVEVDNDTTRILFATDTGFYKVRVINQYQCEKEDSTTIKDICPPRLFVPTGLDPNTEGKWTLDIFGKYYTNFQITIFNRWGEVIFMSNDPKVVWDGTYRGEVMPIGVYNYIVTYEGLNERYKGPYKLKGAVTVVR